MDFYYIVKKLYGAYLSMKNFFLGIFSKKRAHNLDIL
jgi:hypothetical protein